MKRVQSEIHVGTLVCGSRKGVLGRGIVWSLSSAMDGLEKQWLSFLA